MRVTFTCDAELNVIKNKGMIYKNIEVREFQSTTAVLTKLKFTVVAGGDEVIHPFADTVIYTKDNDTYKLASLSYTRIHYQEEIYYAKKFWNTTLDVNNCSRCY